MPVDPARAELGRQGGIKSGEVRRAKAELKAEARALAKFADESDDVAKQLLDAALGRGSWVDATGEPKLDPKERVAVLKTCLEYGIGRPRPMVVAAESQPDVQAQKGIAFGVRLPEVPLPASADLQPQ